MFSHYYCLWYGDSNNYHIKKFYYLPKVFDFLSPTTGKQYQGNQTTVGREDAKLSP